MPGQRITKRLQALFAVGWSNRVRLFSSKPALKRGAKLLVALMLAVCALNIGTKNNSAQKGGASTVNQKGRLTSSGNGQRRTSYEYDDLGRTTRTVHNFEGQSKSFVTAFGLPQNQVAATGLGTVLASQTFPDNERV